MTAKRGLKKLAVALGATLATLAVAELGLRAVGFEFHLYPEDIQFGWPDPEILEDHFAPHADYLWTKKDYAETLARAKAARPHLVLVGCSCTDWGGYDVELAKLAAKDASRPELTMANLACSGWSTYQGLQQMKADVVDVAPAVVTIYFGWNDHWIGYGVADKDAARLTSSAALQILQRFRLVQLASKAIVSRDAGADARPRRVSLEDFRANLKEMVAIAREHDITPVLITAPTSHEVGKEPPQLAERHLEDLSELVPLHRSYADVVREVARGEGVVLCDLAAEFDKLPSEKRYQLLMEDGIHFTPQGAKLTALVLYRCLADNGLLPPTG